MTDRQVLWCTRDTYLLQCPHQGAKNSTIQTSSLSSTVRSKLSSVSSTTSFLLPAPPPLWSQQNPKSRSKCKRNNIATKSSWWASIPVCHSLSLQSFHQVCLWPANGEYSELSLQWPDCYGHLTHRERERDKLYLGGATDIHNHHKMFSFLRMPRCFLKMQYWTLVILWFVFVGSEELDSWEAADSILATQRVVLVCIHCTHLHNALYHNINGINIQCISIFYF